MDKLPRHMRIAALQCDFEGSREQTLKVPEFWQSFGFNVEQLLHTHAEKYSAVFEKEKHGELLKNYLAEERSRGMGTIMYMNCHILLESQDDRAEEWGIVTKEGDYALRYGTYKGCCLNSTWMEYFLNAIEGLKEYAIHGIFFDGPIRQVCYCPRCRASFSEQYGKSIDDGSDAELGDFAMAQYLNAKNVFYDKTKEVNPDWIAYYNENFHLMDVEQMRRSLSCNDFFGTEGGFRFYGPPKNADIWHCSNSAKMAEAVACGKPTVIFIAGDHKSWGWYLHTPPETALYHMSTIANGASVWYGIHGSTDMLNSEAGRKACEVVQFDKKHDVLYQETESLAKVAVFYSFNTGKHYSSSREESDFYHDNEFRSSTAIGNYSSSFNGAVAAIFRSGIPFDILTEINFDRIGQYSMVILPTAACLGDDTARILGDYVENGGILVADSETSLYTETAEKRDNFLMANLFGVDFRHYRRYNRFDYFEFKEDFRNLLADGVRRIPAPFTAIDVEPHEGCEIMAELCPPLAGCYSGKPEAPKYPYILRNKVGKGAVFYFAGTYFELYREFGIVHYKRFLYYLIHYYVRDAFEVLDAPEALEVTVRRSQNGGEVMVHLINYTGGMNRPIARLVPLHGLKLKLDGDYRTVKSLVHDCDLMDQVSNNVLELPTIHEFDVILLEK